MYTHGGSDANAQDIDETLTETEREQKSKQI